MNDVRTAMLETARRVLGTRRWSDGLWREIEDSGLAAAALPVERGGVGTEFGDLLALARPIGRLAPDAPLIETWLAHRALVAAGLDCPEGPLSIAPVASVRLRAMPAGEGFVVDGSLHRVPWGRVAQAVVVLTETPDGPRTIRIDAQQGWVEGVNYAKEPRDTLILDGYRVAADAVGTGHPPIELQREGALFRSLQMAGALAEALSLTVAYAKDRVQFGKPIAKFQAVQQMIARMASEVAAAAASAGAALAAAEREGCAQPWETACAKLRAGEAADITSMIAHEVHAAMGFTQEYALQRSTTRLWSWRDEFGGEVEWATWIGEQAAALGADGLWAGLIEPRRIAAMER